MGIDPDKVTNPRFRELLEKAEDASFILPPRPPPPPLPPKPKRRPQTKESEIHDLITCFCDRNGILPIHTDPTQPSTIRPGYPDFFCAKDGRVVGLEIKVGYNTLSGSQRREFPRIRSCGVDIHLCTETTEGVAYPAARKILIDFFKIESPL